MLNQPTRTGAALLSSLDELPLNRRHWLVVAVCTAGAIFDMMDLQTMSLVSPVLLGEWTLTPRVLGVLTSAAMIGMLCGSVGFGALSDRLGRRASFQLTVAVFAGGSALCALAQDPVQLVCFRFLVGVGVGGFIPVDTALLFEYLPRRFRSRFLALWGLSFPLGGLVATWVVSATLPSLGWRAAFLLGAVAGVMIVVLRSVIPETPYFLVSQGKMTEAGRSARWISGASEALEISDSPDAMSPASPPAEAAADPSAEPPDEHERRRGSFAALFSPGYRARTAVSWSLWFSWSFGYFGITLWLPTLLVLLGMPLGQVLLYTVGFQFAAIAGRVATIAVVPRWGRRRVIVVTGLLAAILMLVFAFQRSLPLLVLVGYLLSSCQEGGFSGIVPFTPDLYPVALRAIGVGSANAAGRAASLLAPLFVGAMVSAGSTFVVFAVFALSFLCAACAVLMFRRSR